jgi:flagellar biosynthetic protein FliO
MNATMPISPAAAPAVPVHTVQTTAHTAANSSGMLDGALTSWAGYFEALAILFFILAALWVVLRIVRKRGGGFLTGGGSAMRVEHRLALGAKKWIVVARILDRRLVLGVTDQQITMLTELDPDERPASSISKSSFAAALKQAVSPPKGGQPGRAEQPAQIASAGVAEQPAKSEPVGAPEPVGKVQPAGNIVSPTKPEPSGKPGQSKGSAPTKKGKKS